MSVNGNQYIRLNGNYNGNGGNPNRNGNGTNTGNNGNKTINKTPIVNLSQIPPSTNPHPQTEKEKMLEFYILCCLYRDNKFNNANGVLRQKSGRVSTNFKSSIAVPSVRVSSPAPITGMKRSKSVESAMTRSDVFGGASGAAGNSPYNSNSNGNVTGPLNNRVKFRRLNNMPPTTRV
jgi:hypothetical protein